MHEPEHHENDLPPIKHAEPNKKGARSTKSRRHMRRGHTKNPRRKANPLDVLEEALIELDKAGITWLENIIPASEVEGERQPSDSHIKTYDHEYVMQRSDAHGGHDGEVYIPTGEGRYFQFHFSM